MGNAGLSDAWVMQDGAVLSDAWVMQDGAVLSDAWVMLVCVMHG